MLKIPSRDRSSLSQLLARLVLLQFEAKKTSFNKSRSHKLVTLYSRRGNPKLRVPIAADFR